jgi:hypothetical protein
MFGAKFKCYKILSQAAHSRPRAPKIDFKKHRRIAIHHNYDDEIRLASGEIELHSFEFHVGPE